MFLRVPRTTDPKPSVDGLVGDSLRLTSRLSQCGRSQRPPAVSRAARLFSSAITALSLDCLERPTRGQVWTVWSELAWHQPTKCAAPSVSPSFFLPRLVSSFFLLRPLPPRPPTSLPVPSSACLLYSYPFRALPPHQRHTRFRLTSSSASYSDSSTLILNHTQTHSHSDSLIHRLLHTQTH